MDIFQWQLKKKQSKHLALELAKASPGHLTDEQLNLPFPLKYIQLWHNIFSIAKISEKKSEIVITQFRPNMQFLCFVFVGKGLQIGWNLHQYAKLQILIFVLIVKSAAFTVHLNLLFLLLQLNHCWRIIPENHLDLRQLRAFRWQLWKNPTRWGDSFYSQTEIKVGENVEVVMK